MAERWAMHNKCRGVFNYLVGSPERTPFVPGPTARQADCCLCAYGIESYLFPAALPVPDVFVVLCFLLCGSRSRTHCTRRLLLLDHWLNAVVQGIVAVSNVARPLFHCFFLVVLYSRFHYSERLCSGVCVLHEVALAERFQHSSIKSRAMLLDGAGYKSSPLTTVAMLYTAPNCFLLLYRCVRCSLVRSTDAVSRSK